MVQFLFYAFGAVLIAAALGVITARNPVHSAVFLVLSFFASAGLWMLLEAEFLAIVLVLVYVGAVMVLFLFVVMMLNVNVASLRAAFTRYTPLGIGVALLFVVQIAYVIGFRGQDSPLAQTPDPRPEGYSNIETLGRVLYTDHVFAFQLAAVILLVAIVAAISLTMRKRPGLKVQDIGRQVAVRRQDRVRLIQMPSERGSHSTDKRSTP